MTDTPRVEQEADRVPGARLLVLAALGLALAMLGVGGAWLLSRAEDGHEALHPLPPKAAFRPATPERTPILGPARGLLLQTRQRQRLATYGWVDRDAGLAHIPIERAIELRAVRAP